jgi:hypothetical protein
MKKIIMILVAVAIVGHFASAATDNVKTKIGARTVAMQSI